MGKKVVALPLTKVSISALVFSKTIPRQGLLAKGDGKFGFKRIDTSKEVMTAVLRTTLQDSNLNVEHSVLATSLYMMFLQDEERVRQADERCFSARLPC